MSQLYGSNDENSEEDLDEEIVATTANVIYNTEANYEHWSTPELDNDSEETNRNEPPPDDIIDINVGGQRMATLRSTLTAVPGSKLATMFAKDTKVKTVLKNTENTVYFFDYNPTHFAYLLDQLRTLKRISNFKPYDLAIQAPNVDVRFNFSIMLNELGLIRK